MPDRDAKPAGIVTNDAYGRGLRSLFWIPVRDVAGLAIWMLALVRRSEPELVREAVRCLGVHGDEDQLEAVIPLCAHPDWPVRAEAIQSVADRGMIRAVPAILRRLETEEDDFVREVILQALRRLESGVA